MMFILLNELLCLGNQDTCTTSSLDALFSLLRKVSCFDDARQFRQSSLPQDLSIPSSKSVNHGDCFVVVKLLGLFGSLNGSLRDECP